MLDQIRSLLKLRPSEVRITSVMFLYIFGVLTFHYILKPLRAGFFLQSFPARDLPYAYMLTAVLAGTIATLVFRYGQQVSLIALITATNVGIILTLLFFRWAMGRELALLPYVYYVYVQTVSAVAMAQFWLLAARVYDSRQAKRTYSLLGAGGIAGAIAGSFVPGFLSDYLSTESMLLICIGIMIGLTGLSRVAWRGRQKVSVRRGEERERDASRDRFRGLCGMVSDSRHLRLMAALVLLTVIGSQLAEWQLSEAVQTHYADLAGTEQGSQINAFFGRFYLVTNVLGILLQVAATGFIVQHFGILAALLFLPIGLLLGGLGVFLVPGLVTVTLTRGNDAALRYSMNRTSLELLYLPLSPMIRERLKVFVDVFIDRVGRAFAGVMILVLTSSFFPVGLRGTALVIMMATGASIVIAIRVRRTYVEEFRQQIERSEVDLSEMTNFVTDPASVQMLIGALGSSEDRRVLYALKLLQSGKNIDFASQLVPLFGHRSPLVRAEALRTLPVLKGNFESDAHPLLFDEDDTVRAAAVHYLLRNDPNLLDDMLWHQDLRIRLAAASWAAWHAPKEFQARNDVVDSLLASRESEVRIAGAKLASRLAEERATSVVGGVLGSAELELAGTAAESAARLGALSLTEPIIEMLAQPVLRKYAKAALVGYGPAVSAELDSALGDPSRQLAVRREIPWVLSRIGGSESARSLVKNLNSKDRLLRYRIVKGLNHIHKHEPKVLDSGPVIAHEINRETRNYYEALTVCRALRDDDSLLSRTIRERLDRDLELIFRLIGLQYPQKDIYFAYSALRSEQRDRRAAALDFIDNVLRADLKSIILPLLEEGSTGHHFNRAAERFGIEISGTEDALKLVLEQSDSWLTACALYEVGRRNMTQMLETCRRLAQEGDSLVRESAGWALGQLETDRTPAAGMS